MRFSAGSIALILFLLVGIGAAHAQTRFGLGLAATGNSADGFGIGLHTRTSVPLNQDFSFGFDLTGTGFVVNGWRDGRYAFEPQVSGIVTLPSRNDRALYVLAGFGGYIPLTLEGPNDGGPTVHLGAGYVVLLNETTVYYEVNPALIIGEDRVDIGFPFRFGVIL